MKIGKTANTMANERVLGEKKVLIAGIGNRLMGDDGFGPRVIDLLEGVTLPSNVDARDFATAGLTVATELDKYDAVIFLDTINLMENPGELHAIDISEIGEIDDAMVKPRAGLHDVGLPGLLRLAQTMGTIPHRIILIGCEPKSITQSLDLSEEVRRATQSAVGMVINILSTLAEG
jgi:hydrogenase maturation protease